MTLREVQEKLLGYSVFFDYTSIYNGEYSMNGTLYALHFDYTNYSQLKITKRCFSKLCNALVLTKKTKALLCPTLPLSPP